MSIRVGLVSAAHVHAPSFAHCFSRDARANLVGVWDDNPERGQEFAQTHGLKLFDTLDSLLQACDAVAIASENLKHRDHIRAATDSQCHVLCEKPIAACREHADEIRQIAEQNPHLVLATAFPCPFSPNYAHAVSRIENGDIGQILAISATNQGKCPGGWFVDAELSGGGAMIDHVVHVADLLRRLLNKPVRGVHAQIGNNMYHRQTDDTAMVTIDFAGGIFATIDSSWSKPEEFETWGNVRLTIVGEKGVIEVDLFSQGVRLVDPQGPHHVGSGTNLDAQMVADFLDAIQNHGKPKSTLIDGLWASEIALAAYESVGADGVPATSGAISKSLS